MSRSAGEASSAVHLKSSRRQRRAHARGAAREVQNRSAGAARQVGVHRQIVVPGVMLGRVELGNGRVGIGGAHRPKGMRRMSNSALMTTRTIRITAAGVATLLTAAVATARAPTATRTACRGDGQRGQSGRSGSVAGSQPGADGPGKEESAEAAQGHERQDVFGSVRRREDQHIAQQRERDQSTQPHEAGGDPGEVARGARAEAARPVAARGGRGEVKLGRRCAVLLRGGRLGRGLFSGLGSQRPVGTWASTRAWVWQPSSWAWLCHSSQPASPPAG